jgi:hypothetical protein
MECEQGERKIKEKWKSKKVKYSKKERKMLESTRRANMAYRVKHFSQGQGGYGGRILYDQKRDPFI